VLSVGNGAIYLHCSKNTLILATLLGYSAHFGALWNPSTLLLVHFVDPFIQHHSVF